MIRGRGADVQRRRALSAAPAGAVRDYLSEPFPAPSTPHPALPLLAVDLETTGLDARHDAVLSIGLVPVDGTTIVLSGARRVLVRGAPVGQSAAIHGLTDTDLEQGMPLGEALTDVLGALRGRVLLAHHAAVERDFLTAACERELGARPVFVTVDTLALARHLLERDQGSEPAEGSLRLHSARSRHGLPRYHSHEALTDALACAELYLAQVTALGRGHPVPLRRLTRR